MRQDTAADAAAKYETYRRAGHPLTPEQVVDELVAEYAERHLREEGAIRRLAGENRTLAEWVRGTIRALAQSIREKLGQAEPTLEHAQRLWERAFRAAEQHASRQNPSVPLPGPETPARYSIREEIDSQGKEAYAEKNTGEQILSTETGISLEGDSEASKSKIPDNDSTIGHIFRDADGHVWDSPENRALLEAVANDPLNFRGIDKYGNKWYTKIQSDGRQVWVESRDGRIFEGGVNDIPKPWNSDTGLKNP